jgi:hypothetical protein
VTGEAACHQQAAGPEAERVIAESAEATQLRLAVKKKAEIKTAQKKPFLLSIVYAIKGQALTRAADQLQQIQSTDRRM